MFSFRNLPGGGRARGGLSRDRRRWALAAVPVAVATGLALVPFGASHAATTAKSTPAAALPVLTLKMTGKVIAVGGSLESGAVRVVSTVTDKAEAANGAAPTLLRLDPGVTYGEFFKVFAKLASSPNSDPNDL